ncbi:hypothetical protein [Streptomyces sp. NPDC017964]|uniref:hypothetical protein n=1 Tax=Streptomyces sp. NPDC017964 TaxID=3365022 RepID=UPI00379395AB
MIVKSLVLGKYLIVRQRARMGLAAPPTGGWLAVVWPRYAATLRTVERVAEEESTHAVTASLLAFLAGLRDDTPDADH